MVIPGLGGQSLDFLFSQANINLNLNFLYKIRVLFSKLFFFFPLFLCVD